MNASRVEALTKGLNGFARKVLDAISEEPTAKKQIVSALAASGSQADIKVVDGCIAHLLETGLVRERGDHTYCRTPAKPRVVRVSNAAPEPKAEAEAPAGRPSDPLEILGAVSQQIRELAATMTKLAEAVEDAALRAEQRVADAKAENAKLERLRDLLREL